MRAWRGGVNRRTQPAQGHRISEMRTWLGEIGRASAWGDRARFLTRSARRTTEHHGDKIFGASRSAFVFSVVLRAVRVEILLSAPRRVWPNATTLAPGTICRAVNGGVSATRHAAPR